MDLLAEPHTQLKTSESSPLMLCGAQLPSQVLSELLTHKILRQNKTAVLEVLLHPPLVPSIVRTRKLHKQNPPSSSQPLLTSHAGLNPASSHPKWLYVSIYTYEATLCKWFISRFCHLIYNRGVISMSIHTNRSYPFTILHIISA